MGSPLSPIIAELAMQFVEERALEELGTEVAFYFRYVDDIIMAVPQHLINKTVQIFNSQHHRLKFFLEIGGDKINFLDITIIKNGKTLEFDWFHKSTFSGRFLQFHVFSSALTKEGYNNEHGGQGLTTITSEIP